MGSGKDSVQKPSSFLKPLNGKVYTSKTTSNSMYDKGAGTRSILITFTDKTDVKIKVTKHSAAHDLCHHLESAVMLIGYARISTIEQNIAIQLDALAKDGCDKIFQDTVSGTKGARKGLYEALEHAREGDTLVVWSLDRLGRSLSQLMDFMKILKS